MIKKQNLWLLTLFSVILVLGVYYITMPNSSSILKDKSGTFNISSILLVILVDSANE